MAPQKPSIFLIGPGLIGHTLLDLLIDKYDITALVRRQEHADQITASGATPVIGSLDDAATITTHTANHDITTHTATADHLPSVQAVLAGLRQRSAANKPILYIHTSGTGVTADDSAANFKSDVIYSDASRAQIDAIPASKPHRDVDTAIVSALDTDPAFRDAKIAIVLPPTIYGANKKYGRVSIQIPYLVRFALKHGYSGHVGKGLAVESQVHVDDLVRGYVTILEWMRGAEVAEVRRNPYWFAENGVEVSWREIAEEIAAQLGERGLLEGKAVKTIDPDHYVDLFGEGTESTIGINSRSRALRLRELGWETREKSWKESLREDELPLILADWEKGKA